MHACQKACDEDGDVEQQLDHVLDRLGSVSPPLARLLLPPKSVIEGHCSQRVPRGEGGTSSSAGLGGLGA